MVNRNIFDEVSESIRAELKSFRKDASKSKTPKPGQGDRRKTRKFDPLTRTLKDMGIQIQDIRAGIGDE